MQMSTPWIYLASPYTHPIKKVEEDRWSRASAICAQIFATGEFFPYSPIAHSHCLLTEGMKHFNLDLNGNFEMWAEYDHAFMTKCDELWILTLEDWQDSKGVQAEIEIARKLHLPIHFVPDQSFTEVYQYIKGPELRWQKT